MAHRRAVRRPVSSLSHPGATGIAAFAPEPRPFCEDRAVLSAMTRHARRRMTLRSIRCSDISLAMGLGEERHAAGAVFYVLRKCDIPRELQRDASVRRAEGTTVIIEEGRITTVYRNKDVSHLRRKAKRSRRGWSDRKRVSRSAHR